MTRGALVRLLTALPLAAAAVPGLAADAPRIEVQRSHAICPLPPAAPGAARGDAQSWLVEHAAAWNAAISPAEALGREVHFAQAPLLVVLMAEQPTLGVRIALEPVAERGWRGRLKLRARVQRPGPGEMAATALSRPCVVAALPPGPWRRISVLVEGRRLEARPANPPAPGKRWSDAPMPGASAVLRPERPAGTVLPVEPPASR